MAKIIVALLSIRWLKAIAKGYTINAISIPADSSHSLASYFTENVIGGPLAFVITPTAQATCRGLRRKLVLK